MDKNYKHLTLIMCDKIIEEMSLELEREMKYSDKTILLVGMQWDYCRPERGISMDKLIFFENLKKMVGLVEPFWFDEYLDKKEKLQEDIIKRAHEIKPDLIFFLTYTDQFRFETLDELKSKYTTYALYWDDQWRFDSYSSKYAPHFTFVSTTDPWSISKYNRIGINPIVIPPAAQPFSENLGPLNADESYDYDVSFVGGYNKYRGWFIKRLLNMGVKVECFGEGWSNGRISFEQMEQIFRKSKINLNISNSINHDIRFVLSSPKVLLHYLRSPKRAEQIKARNFEIPLAGGFQLTNYVLGLERYLRIGEEVTVYNTPEECAQQAYYYLENEELRDDIINKSHERVKNEHTYRHRLERILNEIWG